MARFRSFFGSPSAGSPPPGVKCLFNISQFRAGFAVVRSGLQVIEDQIVCALGGAAAYWNPADKGSGVTLSNSDKDATGDSSSSVRSVTSHSSGKYYFEVQVAGTESRIGIANASATITDLIGNDAHGVAISCESGEIWENGGSTAYAAAAAGGEVYGIGVDMDGMKFYVAIDGAWQNSADPAAGTGGYTFSVSGPYFMALTPDFNTTNLRTASGDFTQTMPSGYTAWG